MRSLPSAMSKRGQDYAARDPEGFAQAMAERPIGRPRRSRDRRRAGGALSLASDASRFLTGHTFLVDGGAHTLVLTWTSGSKAG